MSAPPIQQALVDLVAAIPDIGLVQPYERYAARQAELRALYMVNGAVRGWHVKRAAWSGRRLVSGRRLITTTWTITGFASFRDAEASELDWAAKADAIVDGYAADPTLGGLVRGLPAGEAEGVQVIELTPVMFTEILCHRARLELVTEHYDGAAPAHGFDGLAPLHAWLVTGLVQALRDDTLITAATALVEGALAYDPGDDPGTGIVLTVIPIAERAGDAALNIRLRSRVAVNLAIIVTGPASYPVGAGDKAADGLDLLCRELVRAAHGFGDGVATVTGGAVDQPLRYTGREAVKAAPGRVAVRLGFQAAYIIEV